VVRSIVNCHAYVNLVARDLSYVASGHPGPSDKSSEEAGHLEMNQDTEGDGRKIRGQIQI
jgi:hypothetical protein